MTLHPRLPLAAFVSLLLAPACIIVDDDSGDSGNDDTNATTSNDTGAATGAATGDTAAGSETAANDETGAPQACGWGPTGDEQVPEGYVCGGDGPDPDGMFAIACPNEVTLEVGGECGDIPGPGCCGPQGNVWFCGQGAEGPELAQLPC